MFDILPLDEILGLEWADIIESGTCGRNTDPVVDDYDTVGGRPTFLVYLCLRIPKTGLVR
jgi:hypothetical protein